MEKSDSIKNLISAHVKFQSLVGKIPKDSKNPFFKSKYAALPDILNIINKPLTECGLSVIQLPVEDNGLTTMLAHTSGEFITATYKMIPAKNDPQSIGGCITYQRRYAIGAILCLNIDDDDDGNVATKPDSTAVKPENKAEAPAGPSEAQKKVYNAAKAFIDGATRTTEFAGFKEKYIEPLKGTDLGNDISKLSADKFNVLKAAEERSEGNPAGVLKKTSDEPEDNTISSEPLSEYQNAIAKISTFKVKSDCALWAKKEFIQLQKACTPEQLESFKAAVNEKCETLK